MSLVDYTVLEFYLFLLILFRISGLMIIGPVFGSQVIPMQVKIGLSLLLALILFPLVPKEGFALPENVGLMVLAVLGELAIGVLIGFVASLLFVGIQFGGHIIGQEIGMTLANVIDPVSNQQVSIISQLKFLLALTLFLAIDGHHHLLKAFLSSFDRIPLMGFRFSNDWATHVADKLFGSVFLIGVQVSAPILVALFLTTIAMGFLARAVPEMNIFILGFAIRILMGFAMLIIALQPIAMAFQKLFAWMMTAVDRLVQQMA